jgi:hypothetical protein
MPTSSPISLIALPPGCLEGNNFAVNVLHWQVDFLLPGVLLVKPALVPVVIVQIAALERYLAIGGAVDILIHHLAVDELHPAHDHHIGIDDETALVFFDYGYLVAVLAQERAGVVVHLDQVALEETTARILLPEQDKRIDELVALRCRNKSSGAAHKFTFCCISFHVLFPFDYSRYYAPGAPRRLPLRLPDSFRIDYLHRVSHGLDDLAVGESEPAMAVQFGLETLSRRAFCRDERTNIDLLHDLLFLEGPTGSALFGAAPSFPLPRPGPGAAGIVISSALQGIRETESAPAVITTSAGAELDQLAAFGLSLPFVGFFVDAPE